MDALYALKLIKIVSGLGALVFAVAILVAAWRLRGILNWQRSLRRELAHLMASAEDADENSRRALEHVARVCRETARSPAPDLGKLIKIPDYIRAIAACYHPTAKRPELQITVGRFLQSARMAAERMDLILHRRGFQRLQRIRVRHIRDIYKWYGRISRHKTFRFVQRYRRFFKGIYRFQLVAFPDPFRWLAFLSNRLTILTLSRCLLVDVYLTAGKTAMHAYRLTEPDGRLSDDIEELETTLSAVAALEPSVSASEDPKIQGIRNRFGGFGGILFATTGFREWKTALQEAAVAIAEKHFPAADNPIEEAAIGPLLQSGRVWISSLCETENLPVIKRLHGIKLDFLYQVRSTADGLVVSLLGDVAKTTWKTYRWTRWPIRIYRWLRKASPVGMSLELGWVVLKKTVIQLFYRYTFDTACKEIDTIYRRSRSHTRIAGRQ